MTINMNIWKNILSRALPCFRKAWYNLVLWCHPLSMPCAPLWPQLRLWFCSVWSSHTVLSVTHTYQPLPPGPLPMLFSPIFPWLALSCSSGLNADVISLGMLSWQPYLLYHTSLSHLVFPHSIPSFCVLFHSIITVGKVSLTVILVYCLFYSTWI